MLVFNTLYINFLILTLQLDKILSNKICSKKSWYKSLNVNPKLTKYIFIKLLAILLA